MLTKMILIRHGETVAKRDGNLVCGDFETYLTERGKKQMFTLGKKYEHEQIDVCYCSPRIRSKLSTEQFLLGASKSDIKPIVLESVREISYGEFEGQPADIYKAAKASFFSSHPDLNGDMTVAVGSGAESFSVAANRFKSALLHIAQENPGKVVVVHTHSGVIRALQLCGVLPIYNAEIGTDLDFGETLVLQSDGISLDYFFEDKKRLVYILPEASTQTHMKYNIEFIQSLCKEQDVEVFLILERGLTEDIKNDLELIKQKTGAKYVYYTTTTFLRIPKLLFYLTKAFLLGFRKVYIHYSFVGAFFASINPFFTTYYWNCGLPWKYKRSFVEDFYQKISYRLINYFVTGTVGLGREYAKFYNFSENKIIPIPNWVDTIYVKKVLSAVDKVALKKDLKIPPESKIIFFNQRLAERKGAHYIIPILKKMDDKCVLIVTNDGPYKTTLIKELEESNLSDRVRMLGRVSNEKVLQIMSIANVFILPSEEEGMSHSLIEAFACGVPTVAFDVGATKEIYPKEYSEFAVSEFDLNVFIEKVNTLLSSDILAKNLAHSEKSQSDRLDKTVILQSFISKVLS